VKVARHTSNGSFLDRLTPTLSLVEAGALLGLSDCAAMRTEQNAGHKLESIFRRLGVDSVSKLAGLEDEEFENRLGSTVCCAEEFPQTDGWFVLDRVTSINDGSESLKEAVVVLALLRQLRKARVLIPLLWRLSAGRRWVQAGTVGTAFMYGDRAVFFSAELKEMVTGGRRKVVSAVALVESEHGEDLHGGFELPLARAIAVDIRQQR
jgi:hypothetical protein